MEKASMSPLLSQMLNKTQTNKTQTTPWNLKDQTFIKVHIKKKTNTIFYKQELAQIFPFVCLVHITKTG